MDTQRVYSLSMIPSGDGDEGFTFICMTDAATGNVLNARNLGPEGAEHFATHMALSVEEDELVVSTTAGAEILDPLSLETTHKIGDTANSGLVLYSDDGKWLFVVAQRQHLRIYKFGEYFKSVSQITRQQNETRKAIFSPMSDLLIVNGRYDQYTSSIDVLSIPNLDLVHTLVNGHDPDFIWGIHYSSCNTLVTINATISIWDMDSYDRIICVDLGFRTFCTSISTDGSKVAMSPSRTNKILIYSTSTGVLENTLNFELGEPNFVYFLGSDALMIGFRHGRLIKANAETGEVLHIIPKRHDWIVRILATSNKCK